VKELNIFDLFIIAEQHEGRGEICGGLYELTHLQHHDDVLHRFHLELLFDDSSFPMALEYCEVIEQKLGTRLVPFMKL